MFDITELNDKLVSELREIARSLGIAEADELRKPQLISNIVEQQQLIEAARIQQAVVSQNYSPAGAPDPGSGRTHTQTYTHHKKRQQCPAC